MQGTSWKNIKNVLEELEKRKIDKINHNSLLAFIESLCLVSDLTAKRYIEIMCRQNLIIRDGTTFIIKKLEQIKE